MSSCLNANVARAAAVRRSIALNRASFIRTMGRQTVPRVRSARFHAPTLSAQVPRKPFRTSRGIARLQRGCGLNVHPGGGEIREADDGKGVVDLCGTCAVAVSSSVRLCPLGLSLSAAKRRLSRHSRSMLSCRRHLPPRLEIHRAARPLGVRIPRPPPLLKHSRSILVAPKRHRGFSWLGCALPLLELPRSRHRASAQALVPEKHFTSLRSGAATLPTNASDRAVTSAFRWRPRIAGDTSSSQFFGVSTIGCYLTAVAAALGGLRGGRDRETSRVPRRRAGAAGLGLRGGAPCSIS